MALYKDLKHDRRTYPAGRDRPGQAGWIADRLLRIRAMMNAELISRREPDSLIIGSWNIKHFDGGRLRLPESYHYIAEIIDHFDMCAIQEVKDMGALRRLVRLLGPNWDFFVNDQTTGKPGNMERMAYVYDTNVVRFRNLIGELVFPKEELIRGAQPSRTPFFAAFQAGWFRFTVCSAHIVSTDKPGLPTRAEEMGVIADALKRRAKDQDEVHVFLGDFNQDSLDDDGMVALRDAGFIVPDFGVTNLGKVGKHFDHITFTGPKDVGNILSHGTVRWQDVVFTDDERDDYEAIAIEKRGEAYSDWARAYRGWRTDEMSDHLPIWIELRTDYSNAYLRGIG